MNLFKRLSATFPADLSGIFLNMSVSDAPLLGFRALQSVLDLCHAAGRQPASAREAILARVPAGDLAHAAKVEDLERILARQCGRLETDTDVALVDGLLLAASQPDADLPAFVCATAILLADRIQDGRGTSDLTGYWETYRSVYFSLQRHDRAALIQGFLTGARSGRVRLDPPIPTVAHLTDNRERLRNDLLALARRDAGALSASVFERLDAIGSALAQQHLQALLSGMTREPLTGDSMLFDPLLAMASRPRHPAHLAATALLLAEAIRTGDEEGWFAVTLWPERAAGWLALEPGAGRVILAGLRHLYEADQEWAPSPDKTARPGQATSLPLLPVLDASYAPGHPAMRVT